jgi:hypothetical protein
MSPCDACLDLSGSPSATGWRQGLALLGVGALCGETAVEHYRCVACGASFSRVLLGEHDGRIWRWLECPGVGHA